MSLGLSIVWLESCPNDGRVRHHRKAATTHKKRTGSSAQTTISVRFGYVHQLRLHLARRIHIDMNGLGLQVFLQALRTALPTITTLLVATERRLRTRVERRVDTDSSGLDLAGDAERAGDVGGVERCCEVGQ